MITIIIIGTYMCLLRCSGVVMSITHLKPMNKSSECPEMHLGPYVQSSDNTTRCINSTSTHRRVVISSFTSRSPAHTDTVIPSTIYTTKIGEFVCPPNISEAVAVRITKLAHRPRIASTTIKLISKPILLSILLFLVKSIQRIGHEPNRKPSPPFDSAVSGPSLGHPARDSDKMLWL